MITKEMTVLEIVEKHPETEDVFRGYDDIVGKCVLCTCLFDSIYSIALDYHLDLELLLDKVNSTIISIN